MDWETDKFFSQMASIRMDINDYENWCNTYESFHYPEWTMKNGKTIPLKNMSDEHLENTINLIERKDKTNSWLQILKQEKTYRKNKKKIIELKQELKSFEEIADEIY